LSLSVLYNQIIRQIEYDRVNGTYYENIIKLPDTSTKRICTVMVMQENR